MDPQSSLFLLVTFPPAATPNLDAGSTSKQQRVARVDSWFDDKMRPITRTLPWDCPTVAAADCRVD